MNYEQKYNDALDAARHIYADMKSGGNFGGIEDLEVIFPELRESKDERIRKELVKLFEEKLQKCYEWKEGIPNRSVLDWLEKQKEKSEKTIIPEQKPAEWSEEDEKIRKTLLDYYEKALDNYTCVEWLNGITYGELCDWLKSLQPHWKPSEEQIYSLGTVVKGAGENSVGSVAYNLKELYEQLKALM